MEGEEEGVAYQESVLRQDNPRLLVFIGRLAEIDQNPQVGAEEALLDRSIGRQKAMARQAVARAQPGEPGGDLVGVLDDCLLYTSDAADE